eukprot:5188-Heterococcus_DN1.PRE.4
MRVHSYSRPVLSADLLSKVIPYVGQHEWACIAPVSKYWCHYYYKWLQIVTPSQNLSTGHHIICSDYTATAYVAAVMSGSRLAESLTYGLTTNMRQLQFAAGRRAPLCFLQQTARVYKLYMTTDVTHGAAIAGRLDVLRWLHSSSGTVIDWSGTGDPAVVSGSLPTVQFVTQRGAVFSSGSLYQAVRHGHMQIYDYLQLELHCTSDVTVCTAAAERGDLDLLIKLQQQGNELNKHRVLAAAVAGNYPAIVKWVIREGADLTVDHMALAAASGHTDVCELLRKSNCPWDEDVYSMASQHGHTVTQQWLHNNGCPHADEQL